MHGQMAALLPPLGRRGNEILMRLKHKNFPKPAIAKAVAGFAL
jgi:hypothetical protein